MGSCEMLVATVADIFDGGATIDSTSVRASDMLSIVVELIMVFLPDDGFDDD